MHLHAWISEFSRFVSETGRACTAGVSWWRGGVSRLGSPLSSTMMMRQLASPKRETPRPGLCSGRFMLAWYHGQPDADVQDGTPSCRHADAVDAGSRRGSRITCRRPWCPVPLCVLRDSRPRLLALIITIDESRARLTFRAWQLHTFPRDRYARRRGAKIESVSESNRGRLFPPPPLRPTEDRWRVIILIRID